VPRFVRAAECSPGRSSQAPADPPAAWGRWSPPGWVAES